MNIKKFGLVIANLLFAFTLAAAAPVNVDITFGSDGKVVSSPDGSETTLGRDYALQTDGKIVAVGGGSNLGFVVVRYNSNGSPDTTFGTNGWSSITFADYSTSAAAVDIQTDGKIVVGGTANKLVNNQWTADFAVARFNADGSIDTTFDGDGKTTVSFVPEIINSPIAIENFKTLKTTSDGKIIIGGSAGIPGPGGNSRFTFAKLNADGSLDSSFGTNGKLLGAAGFMYLNDMTVLTDGSFVAVGSEVNSITSLAYKYNAAGSLLWSYSRSEPNLHTGGFYGIAVQPDGKLVAAGKRVTRVGLTRLNADGTEDTSLSIPFMPNGTAVSVAVQPDGKIVAIFNPSSNPDGRSYFNIVRYNSNGSLDSSFGSSGIFTTAVSGGSDSANKILVQPNGKILAGGYSSFTNPTKYYFSMLRILGSPLTTRRNLYDYDGDGKADVSVYRPSEGNWYISRSLNNSLQVTNWGISDDRIVPADYDGDGKTDPAVWRSTNYWFVLKSSDNTLLTINPFALTNSVAATADYDGDGKADPASFRNGSWTYRRSTNNVIVTLIHGETGDLPVPADYDGDGKADLAVFRPSTRYWLIWYSSNIPDANVNFGLASDKVVPADYDGDGKADIAVFRPSAGDWYYLKSSDGSFYGEHFGIISDKPIPADYDGDGKTDIAVYRPNDGAWYLNQSTAGFRAMGWGVETDIPTPAAYNR